jgi:hypothetical protein
MTNPTETGARDVVARIADALRGTTPGEWRTYHENPYMYVVFNQDQAICRMSSLNRNLQADARLIAAAPSLLREAAARIDADAARIAALREQVANLEREIGLMSMDYAPGDDYDDE